MDPRKTLSIKVLGIIGGQSFLSPFNSPRASSLIGTGAMDLSLINLPEHFTPVANILAEGPSLAGLSPPFTKLQRWLKLLLIGGVFEACRRVTLQAWDSVVTSLWTTIDFEEQDDTYGEYFPATLTSTATALIRC